MTDFGTVDDSVAICRGVMYSIAPEVRIVDLTHQVTPFSILDGARFVYGASPYYPAGTVFVVVVDPGVGSTRKAVVVKSKRGQYFVMPDNGLITLVQDRDGIEGAREITNRDWMIGAALSSTRYFFACRCTSCTQRGLDRGGARSRGEQTRPLEHSPSEAG
jgi:S-adenosylmethionine hydrolase